MLCSGSLLAIRSGSAKHFAPASKPRRLRSAPQASGIAIKADLDKLNAPDDLPERVEHLGFELLPITADHAWRVRRLPLHHRDPFDRLLIAQAQVERLPIVTADPAFEPYDVGGLGLQLTNRL
jgi:PIN domain nuclease of toxin-antitoxin system